MSRFAKGATPAPAASFGSGPVAAATPTATQPQVRTHEGGRGHLRDARSDLFLLAVTNMVGQATAYETGGDRDARFVQLVHEVTATDPEWMQHFLPWLRRSGYMRTASVVGVMEYARAGGPAAHWLIEHTLARADEPGEALAYWLANYGRRLPMRVKRGLAAACVKLYRQDTPLRYDSARHSVRPGDVIDLCHPRPRDAAQAALFRHLLDRRHNRPLGVVEHQLLTDAGLTDLAAVYDAESVAPEHRRAWLARMGLPRLMGWERVGGWLPGGMDAQAWEALVPTMGYMALVRNLRNIEAANVSRATQDLVRARLVDPDQVRASRMLPFRFWQAYHATDGALAYGRELEEALSLSCANVPELPGRTLCMVDVSGSMFDPLSDRSTMKRFQAAGLFAGAIALRNPGRVVVRQYGTACHPESRVRSVVQFIGQMAPGGGTHTWACTARAYRDDALGFDRIVILTDEQSHDTEPANTFGRTPIYVWNLAGYRPSTIQPGAGRVVLGGLSDAAFNVVPLVERGLAAGWPWEQQQDMNQPDDTED